MMEGSLGCSIRWWAMVMAVGLKILVDADCQGTKVE